MKNLLFTLLFIYSHILFAQYPITKCEVFVEEDIMWRGTDIISISEDDKLYCFAVEACNCVKGGGYVYLLYFISHDDYLGCITKHSFIQINFVNNMSFKLFTDIANEPICPTDNSVPPFICELSEHDLKLLINYKINTITLNYSKYSKSYNLYDQSIIHDLLMSFVN